MIVVDASVLISILLREPDATAAQRRLFAAGELLHAPHLVDVEVLHVLRRHVLANRILPARAP
jgi:predicted nucleic acid-binding protein